MSFMDPLLALQDIDAQIVELQKEIKDIPARKEAEKAKIENSRFRLVAAEKALATAKAEAADYESQAKSKHDRNTKIKQQQEITKSAKSLEALTAQLSAGSSDADALETASLNVLEALPEAEQRVTNAKMALEDDEASLDGYLVELDQRLEEANSRIAELNAERIEAAKLVAPQHLRVYERLRTSRHPTIVPLTNGVCGGCHLAQPPAIAHLIRRNNALVACQSCGRLLY